MQRWISIQGAVQVMHQRMLAGQPAHLIGQVFRVEVKRDRSGVPKWAQGDQIAPVFVPTISAAASGVSGVRELQFPDLSLATITR